jgi:hypothetical protein
MTMAPRKIIWAVASLGICLIGLGDGRLVAAAGSTDSYPWCVQGSNLHCYYMNREQCEETVDYHGFCVPNPDNR